MNETTSNNHNLNRGLWPVGVQLGVFADNVGGDMIWAWDSGYAYCKGIGPHNEQIIFPSVVGEIPPSQSDLFTGNDFSITLNGNSWLLGDSALRQSLLVDDQQARDWVLSPQWRAMLLAGISQVTKASKVNVEVVTGLPFGDYKEYKQPLIESLLGCHKIKREGRKQQSIEIEGVKVLTQNFAPLFTHLPTLNIDAAIGVLNIGSKTVELATVQLSRGGRPEAIRTQCRTELRGTRIVFPSLRMALGTEYNFNEYELDQAMQNGLIAKRGVGAKPDIHQYVDPYIDSLKSLVSRNWADNMVYPLNKLSHFIITGGGANLVGIELRKWLEREKVGPEIILGDNFDIVKGYQIARKVMGSD